MAIETGITGNVLMAGDGGNVGIGTSTPSQKLVVSGNTLISGTMSATTVSATTYLNLPSSGGGLFLPLSGGTVTGNTNINSTFNVTTPAVASSGETMASFSVSDDTAGRLVISNNTSTAGEMQPIIGGFNKTTNTALSLFASGTTDTGSVPIMSFSSRVPGPIFSPVVNRPLFDWRNGLTQVMTLTATNRLGIGTIFPSAGLHVNASSSGATAEEVARFTVSDNSTDYLRIVNDSTTNAEFPPVIEGFNNGSPTPLTLRAVTGTDSGALPVMSFIGKTILGSVTSRPLFQFKNNANNVMTIATDGNLGLGNLSTPSANLHIPGGTVSAGGASLKIASGSLLTTPEAGAIEYVSPSLYHTNGNSERGRIGVFVRRVTTAATTYVSNITYSNISELNSALVAGATYEIEYLVGISAGSGGARGRLQYSGTITKLFTQSFYLNDGTGIVDANSNNGTTTPEEFNINGLLTGSWSLKGYITTNTAGTLSFQGAQSSSQIASTNFTAGSYVKLTRIS